MDRFDGRTKGTEAFVRIERPAARPERRVVRKGCKNPIEVDGRKNRKGIKTDGGGD